MTKVEEQDNKGMLEKLVHGFPGSVFEEENQGECIAEYTEPHGVDIRIEMLNKSFGDLHVLKDIDLEIRAGETFSIIGPSGTGKSVLLKHIVKLVKPDSGRILIDGHDIFAKKPKDAPREYRYSMVFQTSALFNSLTVGENVGLWLREKRICNEARIRRIIRQKLRLVGLEGKEDFMTSELSGGMKKRVAIARSLAMNPDLILYDEPTAELDPVTSDELARVIMDLKKEVNLTSIIVSHDLNFAFYLSDRVAMIHEGRIIEIGTPAELKASENPVVKNFIFTTTKGITGA
ncbi:ABC transporter ATP-binding protein [Geoalkalibacter halelectricus]|uniref:ABC transporter ATP-binding protein n=2 Tax=Geoalkalibacter halelectricus TaxID=2847045 RepID=A0ABY5ZH92_9BACT|nr:ABC transporter ATP-binding protein [Geoalkalibacter halelectricus]MDO3379657.1 ABC transporter ATP-binding protein [Geoalkalibacter halelectricus]UWZ78527.1 ABC transporter ATP-binding protein [Geoalkalibacter halelectricus]